ncbi:MAG TPA: peptidoglycan editing factor PgeF [Woeseiaceae bacterium]|nr:peptidoglycan editing factor PgeF [Woeseiaceae bacterium]
MQWIRAEWPAPAGVIAGTTTRHGGVSKGKYRSMNLGAHVDDDPECVSENRRRFVAGCELHTEPDWLKQVHGTGVRQAGETAPLEADAAIARGPGAVVAVLTADCLPILLCADGGDEIAAIHAGWRGLAAGIVGATLASMHTPPRRLLAWFGPAISQSAFEVGDEVRAAFIAGDAGADACFLPNERGRWQADLYALGRRQLEAAGVGAVHGGDLCTVGDRERFFSHRRDGQCGRMATFIHLDRRYSP